jgi:hypothetical protein
VSRSDEAPDFAEPIEAWRAWRVVRRDERFVLGSIIQRVTWPPGRALKATCLRRPTLLSRLRRKDVHESPRESCECGIYATSIDHVAFYLSETPRTSAGRVFGLVALWDTVVECERGYRAAQAYPTRIYVPVDASHSSEDGWEEIAFGLQHYGVPIEPIAARSRDAVSVIAEHLAA